MAKMATQVKVAAKPRRTTAKANLAIVAGVQSGMTKAKPQPTETRVISHEEIEKLAYRFWLERGCPGGDAEIDWLRAEQELR